MPLVTQMFTAFLGQTSSTSQTVLSLHPKVELSLVAITCGQKLNIGDISSCQLLHRIELPAPVCALSWQPSSLNPFCIAAGHHDGSLSFVHFSRADGVRPPMLVQNKISDRGLIAQDVPYYSTVDVHNSSITALAFVGNKLLVRGAADSAHVKSFAYLSEGSFHSPQVVLLTGALNPPQVPLGSRHHWVP